MIKLRKRNHCVGNTSYRVVNKIQCWISCGMPLRLLLYLVAPCSPYHNAKFFVLVRSTGVAMLSVIP